jgi:hypothetical protein
MTSEKLKLICNRSDPQDNKLLLLAELFDERCELLEQNQERMNDSLTETNTKLDEILEKMRALTVAEESCPVRRSKDSFNLLVFFLEHPRITLVAILGASFILSGLVSHDFWATLRGLFGV